jgi:SAM-dependent methyltransferase
MASVCPICNSEAFIARGARPFARCRRCGAMERGRMFWMLAKRIGLFREGAKVMHVAPERWLIVRTDVVRKCDYRAFDINADRYRGLPVDVSKIDLCKDLPSVPDSEFDVIVHHHVLEHLPCALSPVLKEFKRILKPGGTMAFSIPIRSSQDTEEDLDPNLSDEERTERFGKSNHVRAFGKDTLAVLEEGLGEGVQADAGRVFTSEELTAAGVPPLVATKLTAHSTILYVKPSRTPAVGKSD